MSDFKKIETQEQFEEMVKDRLDRAKRTAAEDAEKQFNEKFKGYMAPKDVEALKAEYESKIKTLEDAASTTQETLKAKDDEIAKGEKYRTDLEKTRIAISAGLDMKYADRLQGENAEEWQKDAEALAKDFKMARQAAQAAPIGSNEPTITKEHSEKEAFKEWFNENL